MPPHKKYKESIMYTINPTTLEFDLSTANTEEQKSLLDLALRGVREGYVNIDHPAFIAWVEAGNFDSTQGLLCYSTVFMQKVLISFISYYLS